MSVALTPQSRALVVDDDAMEGVLLDNLVESFGYSTKRARSVSEAQRRPHPFEIEKQGASGPTGTRRLLVSRRRNNCDTETDTTTPATGSPGNSFRIGPIFRRPAVGHLSARLTQAFGNTRARATVSSGLCAMSTSVI
ncbi:MAG: Uncharacterised protein [Cellulomonadaceae bacterium TMED98]|nr:MAG: Uncharacterised protein [Cellulomonadaceae bacterium TMED98]